MPLVSVQVVDRTVADYGDRHETPAPALIGVLIGVAVVTLRSHRLWILRTNCWNNGQPPKTPIVQIYELNAETGFSVPLRQTKSPEVRSSG